MRLYEVELLYGEDDEHHENFFCVANSFEDLLDMCESVLSKSLFKGRVGYIKEMNQGILVHPDVKVMNLGETK